MKTEVKRNLEFYNNNALDWAARRTDPFSREKEFVQFSKYFKKGAKIIDIGCAAGIHVPMFLGLGRKLKYEGMDLSKNLITIARRRFPQLKFYVGNLLDEKKLPRKKYDGFWASAVLMHIPEPEWGTMLNNISNMCKPGAVGFLILPKSRPSTPTQKDKRFFTYWDKNKLKKFLEPVKWKILVSSKIFSFNKGEWSWYLVKLP